MAEVTKKTPKKDKVYKSLNYDYRDESVQTAVGSLFLGVMISSLVGGIFGAILSNEYIGWSLVIYTFFFGLYYLDGNEEGVPKVLGQYVNFDGYRLPPGLSWFLPWPLGDTTKVVMTERTSDHRLSAQNTIEVLSWDNVKVKMSFLVQYRVFDSLAFVLVEEPLKALEAAIDETVRWFANLYNADDLPKAKGGASDFISGKKAEKEEEEIMMVRAIYYEKGNNRFIAPGEDRTEKFEDFISIESSIRSRGMCITSAFVDDFGLPPSMTAARAQISVQEAEVSADEKRMASLTARIRQLRKELPDADDEFLLNAAQALQGDASKTVIENRGGAGDFTTGAVISADRQDKRSRRGDKS